MMTTAIGLAAFALTAMPAAAQDDLGLLFELADETSVAVACPCRGCVDPDTNECNGRRKKWCKKKRNKKKGFKWCRKADEPEPTPEPVCGPRVRKAWSTLPCAERKQYLEAVQGFQEERPEVYAEFVMVHQAQFRYAHGTSAFLPWHRWYLFAYENELRKQEGFECGSLPYWDHDRDSGSETESSVFRADSFGSAVEGCVKDGYFAGWPSSQGGCLERSFRFSFLFRYSGTDELASLIEANSDYEGFRPYFEGMPHAAPHMLVGGDMGSGGSPMDPLFFVHHCNVDRVWAVWQMYHGHAEVAPEDVTDLQYFPAGSPALLSSLQLDSPMPFDDGRVVPEALRGAVTPRDMHNIADLGYSYGADALAWVLGAPAQGGEWTWVSSAEVEKQFECGESAVGSDTTLLFRNAAHEALFTMEVAAAERDGRTPASAHCRLAREECEARQSPEVAAAIELWLQGLAGVVDPAAFLGCGSLPEHC